jgi:hypothetical protein
LSSLAIDGIALFKQADAQSRFRIIGEWRLQETSAATK